MLFEPNDALSVRLIGDYTQRDEKCCGAVYVNDDINDRSATSTAGASTLTLPTHGNNIVDVLRDLGQDLGAFQDPYSRDISVTPGRSYDGKTKDWRHLAARSTMISAAPS